MKKIKKSTKILAIVLLSLIIMVIIGMAMRGKLSSDISGWPVYSDDQYGFSIQFPSDWVVEKSAGEGIAFSPKKSYESGIMRGGVVDIFPIGENPNHLSMQDWRKSRGWAVGGEREVKLGENVIGYTINNVNPNTYDNMALIDFFKDDKVFQIKWYDGERENKAAYLQFLKMLPTFQVFAAR